MRNRQWHIKTKGVRLRLSLDTCSASLDVALHVALHLWPKVVSGEHVICLVTAKDPSGLHHGTLEEAKVGETISECKACFV